MSKTDPRFSWPNDTGIGILGEPQARRARGDDCLPSINSRALSLGSSHCRLFLSRTALASAKRQIWPPHPDFYVYPEKKGFTGLIISPENSPAHIKGHFPYLRRSRGTPGGYRLLAGFIAS